MAKTEKTFEKAIEDIFRIMCKGHPDLFIQHNIKLYGPEGARQFDVVITLKNQKGEFITVIEGKDYTRTVTIELIDAFHSKMGDVKAQNGIVVSKMGFTKKAREKAKRLGVILYSLRNHSEIDEIDLKVPILIEEVSPLKIDMFFEIDRNKVDNSWSTLSFKKNLVINNQNLYDLINKGWLNGSLKFKFTDEPQIIEVPSVQRPYFIIAYVDNDPKKTVYVELENIQLKLIVKFNYYLCDIRDIMNDDTLKNINQERIYVFLNSETLSEKLINLKPIKKYQANNFTGVKQIVQV